MHALNSEVKNSHGTKITHAAKPYLRLSELEQSQQHNIVKIKNLKTKKKHFYIKIILHRTNIITL